MTILLFLLCVLHRNYAAFIPNIGTEYWSSGVIDSKILTMPSNPHKSLQSSHVQPAQAQSLFGSLGSYFSSSDEGLVTERDNFVCAKLPLLKIIAEKCVRFERILFVSPQVIQRDTQAVKETFVQLCCGVLGIFLSDREISKMSERGGGFFYRLPADARGMLRRDLNDFEWRVKMKLEVAMIDARPECLPAGFVEEFRERNILLYRHPLSMVENELFYLKDVGIPASENKTRTVPLWVEELKASALKSQRNGPFKICQTFVPVIPKEQLEIEAIQLEFERQVQLEKSEEYLKRLEPIYGRFEEIKLEEEHSIEIEEDKPTEEDFLTEDEYEIIEREDCIKEATKSHLSPFNLSIEWN